MTIELNKQQAQPVPCGGLPVRTNLHAGLAWNDLDDQVQALWDKLTNAVSGDSSSTTSTTCTTPSTPAA